MESGLEGRNNQAHQDCRVVRHGVSMESGLEGRNNVHSDGHTSLSKTPSQ